MDVPVGLVPTSRRMQTKNSSIAAFEYNICIPTVGLDEGTKGVEEPSVTVQLLLVLFLETEDDLNVASSL